MKTYQRLISLLFFLLGMVFVPSAFAEAVITQGNLEMTRANNCGEEMRLGNADAAGTTTHTPCSIVFTDSSYGSGFEASLFNSRGKIWANNEYMIIFSSGNSHYTRSFKSDPISVATSNSFGTQSIPSAQFSLDQTGTMNTLSYHEDENERLNNLEVPTTKFPAGYYAIKDSTGLYWTVYLQYLIDEDNNQLMSWGQVDEPTHPWQACSANDSFSRATGCGGNGGGVAPPVTGGNISVFDGAGSLISPAEDCYGCNKDSALMQPHQGSSSTVVFQWRQISGCSTLAINASSSLPMTLSAKTWSSSAIKETYQATISENNLFSLNSLGEWTTFSITSKSPITHPIRIDAVCADGFTGVSSQQLNPTAVKVDRGATWMGTGSIISEAQQGDANGYGVSQDVSIGSRASNALTSFQWYASQSCSTLRIGDGVNANVTVSGKVWNEASFKQICTTLPCDISVDSTNYYVLKLESSAGALPTNDNFPGGIVGAVCR